MSSPTPDAAAALYRSASAGTSASNRTAKEKDANKQKHSENESARRARLADKFAQLAMTLESDGDSSGGNSRVQILQAATDTIREQKARIARLEGLVEMMQAQMAAGQAATPATTTANTLSLPPATLSMPLSPMHPPPLSPLPPMDPGAMQQLLHMQQLQQLQQQLTAGAGVPGLPSPMPIQTGMGMMLPPQLQIVEPLSSNGMSVAAAAAAASSPSLSSQHLQPPPASVHVARPQLHKRHSNPEHGMGHTLCAPPASVSPLSLSPLTLGRNLSLESRGSSIGAAGADSVPPSPLPHSPMPRSPRSRSGRSSLTRSPRLSASAASGVGSAPTILSLALPLPSHAQSLTDSPSQGKKRRVDEANAASPLCLSPAAHPQAPFGNMFASSGAVAAQAAALKLSPSAPTSPRHMPLPALSSLPVLGQQACMLLSLDGSILDATPTFTSTLCPPACAPPPPPVALQRSSVFSLLHATELAPTMSALQACALSLNQASGASPAASALGDTMQPPGIADDVRAFRALRSDGSAMPGDESQSPPVRARLLLLAIPPRFTPQQGQLALGLLLPHEATHSEPIGFPHGSAACLDALGRECARLLLHPQQRYLCAALYGVQKHTLQSLEATVPKHESGHAHAFAPAAESHPHFAMGGSRAGMRRNSLSLPNLHFLDAPPSAVHDAHSNVHNLSHPSSYPSQSSHLSHSSHSSQHHSPLHSSSHSRSQSAHYVQQPGEMQMQILLSNAEHDHTHHTHHHQQHAHHPVGGRPHSHSFSHPHEHAHTLMHHHSEPLQHHPPPLFQQAAPHVQHASHSSASSNTAGPQSPDGDSGMSMLRSDSDEHTDVAGSLSFTSPHRLGSPPHPHAHDDAHAPLFSPDLPHASSLPTLSSMPSLPFSPLSRGLHPSSHAHSHVHGHGPLMPADPASDDEDSHALLSRPLSVHVQLHESPPPDPMHDAAHPHGLHHDSHLPLDLTHPHHTTTHDDHAMTLNADDAFT